MSTDKFLSRVYHPSRYNCAHFVCEVWEHLKGPGMADALRGFLCAPSERRAILQDLRRLVILDKPEDPCVVFMQANNGRTHVGLWHDGRVLHLPERGRPCYQALKIASLGFRRVRFFTCKNT